MRLIDVDILVEMGMFDEEEAQELLRYASVENDDEDDEEYYESLGEK